VAAVMITRLPTTIGDDEPLPGIFFFQAMFFVELHVVGGVAVADVPLPSLPRKPSQSFEGVWADVEPASEKTQQAANKSTRLQRGNISSS